MSYNDLLYTQGQITLLHTLIRLHEINASISTATGLQYPHHFALQPSPARLSITKARGLEGVLPASHSQPSPSPNSGAALGILPNACAVSTGTSHQGEVYYCCCAPVEIVTANKLCCVSREFPNKIFSPLRAQWTTEA